MEQKMLRHFFNANFIEIFEKILASKRSVLFSSNMSTLLF